jgi:hypothetical protein
MLRRQRVRLRHADLQSPAQKDGVQAELRTDGERAADGQ